MAGEYFKSYIDGSKTFYFVESRNIKVFPCSYRGYYDTTGTTPRLVTFDPEARLNTEANFIHAGAGDGSTDSYIINWIYDNPETAKNVLKCIIGGYYFEIFNVTPADFKARNVTTLYIKTRNIEIQEATDDGDRARSTEILGTAISASDLYLDKPSNGLTLFTGLFADVDNVSGATYTSKLTLVDGLEWRILTSKFLPKLFAGKGELSVVINDEDNEAIGNKSVAMGEDTFVKGNNSVAEGHNEYQSIPFTSAAALTYKVNSTWKNAFHIGDYIFYNNILTTIESITDSGGENIIIQLVDSIGMSLNNAYVKLIKAGVFGKDSHGEGKNVWVDSQESHAEGSYTKATGSDYYLDSNNIHHYSRHAEGILTVAEKAGAHAEGIETTALGTASHAEGKETSTNGNNSHAEGYKSVTGGDYETNTLAAGTGTNGAAAHAEGNATIAKGVASHSEGRLTFASGENSHAEGDGTTASGNAAHAEGLGTTANQDYQHVFGKYNNTANDSNLVEMVGWGTDSAPKNIRTLDANGNEELSGSLSFRSGTSLKATMAYDPDREVIKFTFEETN